LWHLGIRAQQRQRDHDEAREGHGPHDAVHDRAMGWCGGYPSIG
jgi:hypothetical protein